MFEDLLEVPPQVWSWAFNIALLMLLRETLKHQRSETVPRKVFETEQESHKEQHGECSKMLDALQKGMNELATTTGVMLSMLSQKRE